MEGLEDQIEKLSTLLAALEIPEEQPDKTEKIVLYYSSDENPYDISFLVKAEEGGIVMIIDKRKNEHMKII